MGNGLDVSVVMATHNRPDRLAAQIEALREQTLAGDRYEIIIVDDGSGPETVELLERAADPGGSPALHVIRHEQGKGPAAARNAGWRRAKAPLIAFTDDDCRAPVQWLEAGLAAAQANPGAFVQGPTVPIPEEWPQFGPFSHTVNNRTCGPGFETANIFYPRELLERVDGFDEVAYTGAGGEDTDLAWKCIEAGVDPVWAEDALMYHAVTQLGPMGRLRRAAHWHESMLPFKRYAGLRKHRRGLIFWSNGQWWMFRFFVALLIPKRFWWLRWWLAAPYVAFMTNRRSGPLLVPYFILHDLVEMVACVRGSIRYRVWVI